MRGVMPDAALGRVAKVEPVGLYRRGFAERARAVAHALFTDSQLAARGIADEAALRANYDAVIDGRGGHDPWWALTMEMWLRRWWTS